MASLNDALVQQLLKGRYIAALATESPDGSIHMVAVWYWFDGTNIFVATVFAQPEGAQSAIAGESFAHDRLPRSGSVVRCNHHRHGGDPDRGIQLVRPNARVHERYMSAAALADPKVGPVFAMWDDVTIRITPKSVITWDMRVADQQAFGGAFARNPGYLLPLER